MAVTTVRLSEMVGRNIDKMVMVTNPKPTPGPLLMPPMASDGVTRERAPGCETPLQNSRATSPERMNIGRDGVMRVEEVSVFSRAASAIGEDGPEEQDGEASGADPQQSNVPVVTLETCPSFAEQRSKPLWLERHQTLQSAYLSFVVRSSLHETDEKKEDECGQVSKDLSTYLPGWDIWRSNVWLMAETALLRLQTASPQSATANSDVQRSAPVQLPSASEVSAGTDTRSDAQTLPPHHLHHDHIHHHHLHHPNHHQQEQPQQHAQQHHHQHQQASPQLSRCCSQARPCPPIPRGFGPQLLSLTPSMSMSLRSARSIAQQVVQRSRPGPNSGTDAAKVSPSLPPSSPSAEQEQEQAQQAGQPQPQPQPQRGEDGLCPRRRRVAFAAGLAAATSTAAAVSSAAAIATAGLAAATVDVAGTASAALHFGSRILNAGGNVLADKVQNVATKHVTEAVAHVVLGEEAPPSMRLQLVNRVQAVVAGASILWFLFNLATMSDTLAHLDFEHDFATSAKVLLDLATSGPGLMENCRDLLQIGVAVGLGVAERTSSVTEAL